MKRVLRTCLGACPTSAKSNDSSVINHHWILRGFWSESFSRSETTIEQNLFLRTEPLRRSRPFSTVCREEPALHKRDMSELTVLPATGTTFARGERCATPLRVAITVDPEIPVPPVLYGGIERIVDMLLRGLMERGHEITLFAHPDSHVPCHLVPYPRLRSQSKIDTLTNMWHVSRTVDDGNFDLVHSFARLAYLTPLLLRRIPKIMSYQRGISPRSVRLGTLLSRGTLSFTGCSAQLIRPWQSNDRFHVVYNGVPLDRYSATDRVGEIGRASCRERA